MTKLQQRLPEMKGNSCLINNLIELSYVPKVLHAAIRTGIFEALAQRPYQVNSLAEELHLTVPVVKALCNVLVALRILKQENDMLSNSDTAADFLVQNSSLNQIREILETSGSVGRFDSLEDALRGIVPSMTKEHWINDAIIEKMLHYTNAGAGQNVRSFVRALPGFTSMRHLCDLAGGMGHYSRIICRDNPGLKADVYDLPEVIELVKRREDVKDWPQIRYNICDLKTSNTFGSDYDIVFISNFLYGFDVEQSLDLFFEKVNRSVVMGGFVVSNHMSDNIAPEQDLIMKMLELYVSTMGHSTHIFPYEKLKNSMQNGGFEVVATRKPCENLSHSYHLVAARKVKEIAM